MADAEPGPGDALAPGAGAQILDAGSLLAACPLPRAEGRALLAAVLEVSRETLAAHPELPVATARVRQWRDWVDRRRAGEPMAYLLGTREFYGRPFGVGPEVLVPRPETELLVELCLPFLRARQAPALIDLGTGSGCLAISLALEVPQARVLGVDASAQALARAQANALALGATVQWQRSDWFAAVGPSWRHLDLIVANPPYVAEGDPHLPALHAEPLGALAAGPDGLADLRRIIALAPGWLQPGGWLALEHGHDQQHAVVSLVAQAGLALVACHADAAGVPRVVVAAARAA